MRLRRCFALAVFFLLASYCTCSPIRQGDEWDAVRDAINANNLIPDVTVVVGDRRGNLFLHEKGKYTYESSGMVASSSKWITSMTFGKLLESGKMRLDDLASKYISFWTTDRSDWRSRITLSQLLSFTSSLNLEQPCLRDVKMTIEECVRQIYTAHANVTGNPGTEFYYGGNHMQVAGLMAIIATGQRSYNALFIEYFTRPLGIESPCYYYAEPNPIVAGGLVTSTRIYRNIMFKYYMGEALLNSTVRLIESNYVGNGVEIVYSPHEDLGYTWGYGLGHWIECTRTSTSQPCPTENVHSSGGLYGFYPYIDRSMDYWAIFGVFQSKYVLTLKAAENIRPLIEKAVMASREPSDASSETPSPMNASPTATSSEDIRHPCQIILTSLFLFLSLQFV